MESKCLPDKPVDVPPVPIKTYQWEDLRRARDVGAYPWTHLLKPHLEGEITAEDILRETSPRRSMSRDVSRERTRSRTRSPDSEMQRILNLDSSPGSSRKIGEDGEEDSIQIPNFSKEVSLDSEEDPIDKAVHKYLENQPKEPSEQLLAAPAPSMTDAPRNISPKSILKRRVPVQPITKITETRDNTKCCHPLVNKIKHIADKTLHKHDKSESNKSPNTKRKKQREEQAIVQLKSSPGAVRRQKFSAIKLGDSDEMSRTLSIETSPQVRKRREHIYEDIEQTEMVEPDKSIQFSAKVLQVLTQPLGDEDSNRMETDKENVSENKSDTSQDPSLLIEEEYDDNLRPEEHIMESLHKHTDVEKEALVLEVEDSEEPDIEDIIQNQLEECFGPKDSPNITITEITDEEVESKNPTPLPKEPEQEGALEESPDVRTIHTTEATTDWSKSNSDHEYEIIGKPPPNIVFTIPSVEEKTAPADDELSSTTSLERKYLQHASDDEDHRGEQSTSEDLNGHEILAAEALQKDIEDRYFVSTPSTVSRTECEISTSQVDSSALENLPLKRDSRANADIADSKLQQRFKEQTGKLKTQAGKLKSKLQSIKTKQFSLPDRSKFKFPQMPERPKFTMPDRRKFSLPERPKFKKINISEKLSVGDRKKFTFPDRPKFTMPDLPKFKIPEKAKIHFSSLGRKKEYRVEPDSAESSEDIKNVATVEFESRTYPRLFNRKKQSEPLTSSSPTINREDTPPPVFNFAKVSRDKTSAKHYQDDDADEPREYGNLPRPSSFHDDDAQGASYDTEYDFDRLEREYDEENRRFHEAVKTKMSNDENTSSLPDVSSSKPECTHVINEINNDEFFVRPKGISRENIEVRQYLSDEIREAFKMPTNSLALMGSSMEADKTQYDVEGEDADPDLYLDDEPEQSITENIIDKDDGYYTFPPVRPSRAKKLKKQLDSVEYIDESINASMQFSDVDIEGNNEPEVMEYDLNFEDNIEQNPRKVEEPVFESQTLPMPPKRKKKFLKSDISLSSLNDLRRPNASYTKLWSDQQEDTDDIIVYRTEHEYVVPESSTAVIEQSPLPPRRSRNRSRSSHGTSLADDDRTSHGAESLALDPNLSTTEPTHGIGYYREAHQESPGYATVDKYPIPKSRRSKSKTPPARRRKSHSSERKYYTVYRVPNEPSLPDRPPRKKSSTSLVTLESFKRGVSTGDVTQYVEIDELDIEDHHRDLKSGEIISKMKDRPLPPPPRPPRGPKKSKTVDSYETSEIVSNEEQISAIQNNSYDCQGYGNAGEEVVEMEVSTQTDPLPDDIDYELGMDDPFDVSMSSSLRDVGEDDIILSKSQTKLAESPRDSRPTSRSDKSLLPSDPKIQELSRSNLGRTSPTVILVERRVSSPTRINEREEIVTEASLTVQPIDVDESLVPDVPPLPRADVLRPPRQTDKRTSVPGEERALEKVGDVEQVITDIQLDNLVTQRLQVRDLDVGKLNVSELQASKILVSEIEGMTLQVTELDSKSGHISVSGIELSPSVIDEIVKKFAELATTNIIPTHPSTVTEHPRPISREEQTQTDEQASLVPSSEPVEKVQIEEREDGAGNISPPTSLSHPSPSTEATVPPVRPPPPDLSPLLYSYLQDLSIPPASFYQLRAPRERPFSEFFESQGSTAPAPPPPTRRVKRKPMPHSGSSSDEDTRKPSPRRMGPATRTHEPSITEAGAQFIRVCHNSISRTLRGLFNSLMSYVSGSEDKKDVQMALVIFLVLIAGLIMFGLSDGRTVHHHHWEFFNPPDGNSK